MSTSEFVPSIQRIARYSNKEHEEHPLNVNDPEYNLM